MFMLHFLLGKDWLIIYVQYTKYMNKYLCGEKRNILVLVLASWCIKLLMIPAYYSTDFEVHQNWLRITHEKPLSQWYYDEQSKWTLDYPPLFAYFEYLLSIIANTFNSSIVKTINQFPQTVIFQRLSVTVTDIFYLWALLRFNSNKINLRVVILYLWIPFLILDNIHFQYNLLMQALMIFSVGFMQENRFLVSAFCFSALLNFKHIYLYCAPAFFVYLLKQYVFKSDKTQSTESSISNIRNNQQKKQEKFVIKLIRVGVVTLIPFVVSFGPFFIVGGMEGIKQIFSRLFPFGRGLIHQYWAPNFWALYYFVDKILMAVGFQSHQLYKMVDARTHQMSAVNTLKVLPAISPSITILIILSVLTPILISYFFSKTQTKFTNLVCISGLIFFMFGYHVHEKAIIPYLNLLFFFCPSTPQINTAVFVSIVNLVPLLIQPKQSIFCVVCCLVWLAIWDFIQMNKKQSMFNCQEQFIRNINWQNFKKVAPLYAEYVIQVSGILIIVYHLFVHPVIKSAKLQFLPFLLNSVWAASLNTLWIGYLYYKFIKSLFNRENKIEVQ